MKWSNKPRDYARRMESKSRYSIEDSEGEANAAAGLFFFVVLVVLFILLAMVGQGWIR